MMGTKERQLMQVVADWIRLRWYLGYDPTEPLPDHSSLTRTRERFGLEIFRRFFAATEATAVGGTAPSCPSLFQQAGPP